MLWLMLERDCEQMDRGGLSPRQRLLVILICWCFCTSNLWAEPTVEQKLEDYFALPGFSCYDLSSNPGLQEKAQQLTGDREELLALANSPELAQRALYLALHRAFAAKSPEPEWKPGRVWPSRDGHWLSENGELRLAEGEIDYLIVGSGPAGSVLAHELSRAGFRTVVVERGSLINPGTVDTRLLPFLKVGGGAVPTEDAAILVRNGMAVGGGATVNVDLAFSPELPFVRKALAGWNLDTFRQDKVVRAYAWVRRQIGTRTPSTDEINANNRILLDGAAAVGLEPHLYDLNLRGESEKLGAADRLLKRALEAGYPLHILSDLEVRRVVGGSGEVSAVEAVSHAPVDYHGAVTDPDGTHLTAGEQVTIKARHIILSAGTQGSAAILLRSGLGGPMVGKGVVLHPSMPLIGLFSKPINNLKGVPSTVYATDPKLPHLILECMTGDLTYASAMLFGRARERARLLKRFDRLGGFGVLMVDRVNPNNRIEIDDQGEPRVVYNLERERFAQCVAVGVEAMLAGGAKEVYLPSTEPLDGSEHWNGHLQPVKSLEEALALAANLHCVPGRTVITSAHMQGSCKMGVSPEKSVVDPEFKVWGYSNFYVCDTSVFPTSVGANPMQTAYTTGKLLADKLCEGRSGQD